MKGVDALLPYTHTTHMMIQKIQKVHQTRKNIYFLDRSMVVVGIKIIIKISIFIIIFINILLFF